MYYCDLFTLPMFAFTDVCPVPRNRVLSMLHTEFLHLGQAFLWSSKWMTKFHCMQFQAILQPYLYWEWKNIIVVLSQLLPQLTNSTVLSCSGRSYSVTNAGILGAISMNNYVICAVLVFPQVPFTTMLGILCMWFGISTPLTFLGYYFGYRKKVSTAAWISSLILTLTFPGTDFQWLL